MEAGFVASASSVIAGTSAGAIVGAYVAQGRAMPELARLESLGQGFAAGQQPSNPTIPDDIIGALVSTEGTFEDRGARLGKLALGAPTSVDQPTFVDGFQEMLGTDDWPDADFRPATVSAETGKTTLWDRLSALVSPPRWRRHAPSRASSHRSSSRAITSSTCPGDHSQLSSSRRGPSTRSCLSASTCPSWPTTTTRKTS